jgi:hypothetical protein
LKIENNVEKVPQQTGKGKIEGRKCFAVQILTKKEKGASRTRTKIAETYME